MKTPYYVPAELQDEAKTQKPGKPIREILRKADNRARRLFERHDSNPPDTPKKPQPPSPKETER
jgi:hypothetical protein